MAMMTSTFPGSRSGSSQSLKGTIQEIQSKRDALMSLEAALKRRINEFKELCLKEGEITGQLPADYPLQPREPIPQVRRRTHNSNSSTSSLNNDTNRISPPASISSCQRIEPVQAQSAYAISSGGQVVGFPPRPTSTNSTSSSISTASSNTRSLNQQPQQQQQTTNMLATSSISSPAGSISNRLNGIFPNRNTLIRNNHLPPAAAQFDYSPMQTTRFKRPLDLPSAGFDVDSNSIMRASSTASSSSSSGSAASSTLSTATMPNTTRLNNNINLLNLHARSCSESMNHDSVPFHANRGLSRSQEQQADKHNSHLVEKHLQKSNSSDLNLQPVRPPRGIAHDHAPQVRKFDSVDGNLKMVSENRYQAPPSQSNQLGQKSSEGSSSSSLRALQHINIEGVGSFQPYYEETKPFQMSDFYKYSSKHRQKVSANDLPASKTKTTRQLQEDVKKNSLKFSTSDDQRIQNSIRIIEKSGQKLIEATAKAIAVNPGLAEKISNILPNTTGDKY